LSPSSSLLLLAKTVTHPAAWSLCDSWASCYRSMKLRLSMKCYVVNRHSDLEVHPKSGLWGRTPSTFWDFRRAFTLHYIIKLFIVAKVKNCKVHYGASHTTMSGYDCRNKCVFSFRRNDNNDVAEVTFVSWMTCAISPIILSPSSQAARSKVQQCQYPGSARLNEMKWIESAVI